MVQSRDLAARFEAYSDWRRRLSARLEELLAGPEMARVAALVTAARRDAAPGAAP